MSFGKAAFGFEAFGGLLPEPQGVVASTSSPQPLAAIAIQQRVLKIHVAYSESNPPETSEIRVALDGVQLFNGSTWISGYTNSYWYYDHTDQSVVLHLERDTLWEPRKRYEVTFTEVR